MKKFAALLPIVLMLAACNGAATPPPSDDAKTPVDYVGMTVEQATEKAAAEGVPFRVVMENGEALPVTMDYVIGRINAEVTDGIVTKYAVEGSEDDQPAADEPSAIYDQNSWRTMIPDSCASFFDGCNNCRRMEGEAEAACTRMFCETYEKPVCTDAKEAGSPGENPAPDGVQ
jgi:hypothetical protein